MKQKKNQKRKISSLEILFAYKTRKFPTFFIRVIINTILSFFVALYVLLMTIYLLYSYVYEKKQNVGNWGVLIFLIVLVISAALFAYVIYLQKIKKRSTWYDS